MHQPRTLVATRATAVLTSACATPPSVIASPGDSRLRLASQCGEGVRASAGDRMRRRRTELASHWGG